MTNRTGPSCVRCAERKVRCDRQMPCGPCTKHNANCVAPTFKISKRKERRSKQQALEERVKHCQTLLGEHHSNSPDNATPARPSASEAVSEPGVKLNRIFEWDKSITKTQLLNFKGSPNFVDNSLLSRVAEEFDGEDIHEAGSAAESESDSEHGIDSAIVMESTPRSTPRHPSPSHILKLWKAFCDNIDPLTKVIHVPTFHPLIERAAEDDGEISKNLEALMFAMYSTAILSLTDSYCLNHFGEARKVLLRRYVSETKAALSRARFMASTSLLVIQALSLHIVAIRDSYEPRVVWNLVGLALRMGQGIGLDRNGEDFGLSVFDSECRRRIWWFLKFHESRSAELCGLPKFQHMSILAQMQVLVDIDDDELHPNMTELPGTRNRITDSIFCSSKTKFVHDYAFGMMQASEAQSGLPSKEERATISVGMKDMYETKYIRYLEPTKPLHLLMMLYIRYTQNVHKLLTNHPRAWTGSSTEYDKEEIWHTCMNLFEQFIMIQTSPHIQRFAWNSQYYLQWHALIYVLDVLRAEPKRAGADEAWDHIQSIYENNPEFITNVSRPIYLAIGQLCLKAFDAKERRSAKSSLETPSFIMRLREVSSKRTQSRKQRLPPMPVTANVQSSAGNATETSLEGFNARNTDFLQMFDLEWGSDFWLPFNDDFSQPKDWTQWDNLARM